MSLRTLLTHSWWRHTAGEAFGFSPVYHWFNLAEGVAWCLVAGLVVRRFARQRKSKLEIIYALAFLTFGVSDFVEAQALTTWLILAKGLNLAVLFALRRHLLRRHYPASKTY
ncbi:MAG TPA: hypothetical protein VFI31_03355 [Pirellulales bacterium]|nr:hypothetical protein [Pirellulales bacterium]